MGSEHFERLPPEHLESVRKRQREAARIIRAEFEQLQKEGRLKKDLDLNEEINTAGGIKGRKIEIIEEDSGASNTTALNALSKVLEQKPVAVLGATVSPHVAAMMPEISKEGVPFFIAGTAPQLFSAGNKWVFGINPSDDIPVSALTRYAIEKLGAKQVGMITTNDEPGQSIVDIAKKGYCPSFSLMR